uniref:Myb/SANT-like DNA-binding domain-containing protein n=1 Tax=Glossina brevipalpis TaxID=37001 RepID=A0A1A9X1R2_9MUSC
MLIQRLRQPSSSSIYPILIKGGAGKSVRKFSILKMSQSPTNKLPLASTNGTAVATESNALLTPIHNTRSTDKPNRPEKRRLGIERNLWRSDEVMCMLKTMQKTKALELLNDKSVKSEKVFKDVEEIMFSNGYRKKSHLQIWTKWKFLKSTYMTSRRTGIMPRMVCSEIYSELHKMLNNRSGANGVLSDCGNSTTGSMDDDTSNVGSSSIVISGVEGGVSTIQGSDEADVIGDRDDHLDIAHPIFGFRLGLVKPEPADTGYETVENNGSISEKDPLEDPSANINLHKPSTIHVKQEIEEEDSTEIETEENIATPTTEAILVNKQPIRFVQQPKATSTPNATANECPTPPLIPLTKLPPLRVAQFAKTIDVKASNMPNRPPPPLTMPPTPRPIHVTNLSNPNETSKLGGIIKFSRPNVVHNFSGSSQIRTPLRISKEITIHSRNTNAASSSFPKLKQVPMRKTPYSLRPDRAIPDLDDSTSPPASEASSCSQRRLEEVPSTSQLTMQSQEESSYTKPSLHSIKKKRRLDWQPENQTTVKMPKIQNAYSQRKPQIPNDSEEEDQNDKNKQTEEEKYEKLLNHVVQEVSTSLRDMQKEMMHGFLKTQQQLIRQEHEFQMQQDLMLMKAFQEQTRNIMRTVDKLWATKPTTQTNLNENKNLNNPTKKCKEVSINHNTESIEERFEDQANQEDDEYMADTDEDESQGHIQMYLRNGLEEGDEKQLHSSNQDVEAGEEEEDAEEVETRDVGENKGKETDPSNDIQDVKVKVK